MDTSHVETQLVNDTSQGKEKHSEAMMSKGKKSSEMLKASAGIPKSTSGIIKPSMSEVNAVGHNQDKIFTRIFVVQWLIMIASTVVVCHVCFTFYIHYIQKELADDIVKFRLEVEEIEDALKQMKRYLAETSIEALLARQERQASLLVVLATIFIVLLCCVFWLYQRQQHSKDAPSINIPITPRPRKLGHQSVHQRSDADVRNRGTSVVHMDKACIILFNAKLRGEITKLLEDLKMPDFQYEFMTIRKDEDIHMLPRCKVFLMVCEFTERHVIIEQKGLGLGDLHRNTYDKTMQINGNLIILFFHDPGSRKLGDGKPYNENIHCVKSQPELSDLTDTGSFFSCYNQLTDFQTNKLREKMK